MNLSARTRYGTRALIELGIAWQEDPISVASIASRQGLSPKFLEQIMVDLKANDLVRAVKGRGYRLAQDPQDLLLSEIVNVLEVSENVVQCLEVEESCPREGSCPVRSIWEGLDKAVDEYLGGFTLADLLPGSTAEECDHDELSYAATMEMRGGCT